MGAALFQHALDDGWLTRKGATRVITLTDTGRAALRERLGLDDAALNAPDSPPQDVRPPHRHP